ncbi:MAG: hypothetical protein QOF34_110, partial [Sphingomonadales bacterium]|nr:hypothetical protein [Sphingomonadales bacterium]
MFAWLLLSAGAATYAEPRQNGYQVGQVWEYRTRPEDAGSLLRIQKIEEIPASAKVGPVYHISVIGVHFGGSLAGAELQHLPVSRETLDASVTRLSSSKAAFPDPSAGIAEWRSAKG